MTNATRTALAAALLIVAIGASAALIINTALYGCDSPPPLSEAEAIFIASDHCRPGTPYAALCARLVDKRDAHEAKPKPLTPAELDELRGPCSIHQCQGNDYWDDQGHPDFQRAVANCKSLRERHAAAGTEAGQ